MEQATRTGNSKEIWAIIRKILLFVFIIAFFVGIVFVYYIMIYSTTRENIINNGRINAIESADQANMRMNSSMDIMKIAAYTIDNMLAEGRSNREILDYIVNETIAVHDLLLSETTGIYGYINDEYMDGLGWVPEDDYEPTTRPWYTSAIAGNGEIVVADPYLDLYTGNVIITIVKMLKDGKSVVALDLSMEMLQEITEEHVAQSRSYAEGIISKQGKIITHSDTSLIGTNYQDAKDRIGVLIAERMTNISDKYFYLEYENRDYMVYVMPLINDWLSICIIDATDDFNKLRMPFYVTIAIAVVLVGVLAYFMIRSDIKSREARELAVKSEIATASSEAKSSFLSNMSHEIRTPINAILGMNEMVIRETDDDSILTYSENIKNAGSTLLGIINDILDFSKIEAGRIEIIPIDYDVPALIGELVNMISARAEEKELLLILELDPDIPKRLTGDEMRIKQVITNILTNAVKYTEQGSITLRMGYEEIEDEVNSVMLNVSVEDTGIGIREEDLTKLFLEFERIDERRNRNIEGTGLGMSITKSLLQLMGSELKVKSTYGVGSEFGFSVRQRVADREPMGDYKSYFSTQTGEHEKYKERFTAADAVVLMVDDNPMNLMVFKSLIKQTLVQCDTANDGYEGLKLAQEKKYDMIFLDHMMPGKDGIETLHDMTEQPDSPNLRTPKICLTANAISGAREKYISEGFNDYLTKPIDPDELEKMLLQYLPEDKVKISSGDDEFPGEDENEKKALRMLAPLKDNELIDIDEGIANSGSADTYIPLLKIFYDTTDEKLAEIIAYYEAENIKDYTIKVHALKSSLRIIGAAAAAEDAQTLEDAGKREDTGYIDAHQKEFIEECRTLKGLLTAVFEAKDGEAYEKPMADMVLMKMTYDEIRHAAEEMDCGSLEAIFGEMADFGIPESEAELFGRLKTASENFEYDRILQLLKENKQ